VHPTSMVVVVECTAVIEIASRFSTTRYLRVFVRVDAHRSPRDETRDRCD